MTVLNELELGYIQALIKKNSTLLNIPELSNCGGLSEELIRFCKSRLGSSYPLYLNNTNIPKDIILDDLDLYSAAYLTNVPFEVTHFQEQAVVFDPDIIEKVKNNPYIIDSLAFHQGWYKYLGFNHEFEGVAFILSKYKGTYCAYNRNIIESTWIRLLTKVIKGADRLCPDTIKLLSSFGSIFRSDLIINRTLTEDIIDLLGIPKELAWYFCKIEQPEKFQPAWTNAGDPMMVSPNMPLDWALKMASSKKDSVAGKLALFGPEEVLPMLLGCKKHPVQDVIEARLKNKKIRPLWPLLWPTWEKLKKEYPDIFRSEGEWEHETKTPFYLHEIVSNRDSFYGVWLCSQCDATLTILGEYTECPKCGRIGVPIPSADDMNQIMMSKYPLQEGY
jgi:hypothetical protein